jgi:hypothetical protein
MPVMTRHMRTYRTVPVGRKGGRARKVSSVHHEVAPALTFMGIKRMHQCCVGWNWPALATLPPALSHINREPTMPMGRSLPGFRVSSAAVAT